MRLRDACGNEGHAACWSSVPDSWQQSASNASAARVRTACARHALLRTSGRRRLPGALWFLSVADGRQSVPCRRISGTCDTVRVERVGSDVANRCPRVAGHRDDGARSCHQWCGVGDLLRLPGRVPLEMSGQLLPLTVGVLQVVGALVQVIALPYDVIVAPVMASLSCCTSGGRRCRWPRVACSGRRSGVARPRSGLAGRRCAGASHRDRVKTSGQARCKSSHCCCSSSCCWYSSSHC